MDRYKPDWYASHQTIFPYMKKDDEGEWVALVDVEKLKDERIAVLEKHLEDAIKVYEYQKKLADELQKKLRELTEERRRGRADGLQEKLAKRNKEKRRLAAGVPDVPYEITATYVRDGDHWQLTDCGLPVLVNDEEAD